MELDRWVVRFVPSLAVAVLFTNCLLMSPKKELWVDEVYSINLAGDPGFGHALKSLYHGVDGGMPLYYVLANPFAHIFGAGILTLRLLSCLSVAGGMLILWRLLRDCRSVTAAAISLLAVALNSTLLLYQSLELRYYGVYFLCAALVLLAHQHLTDRPSDWRTLTFAWAAHALLLFSHVFGVLYSAAALLGMIVAERTFARWKVYLFLASSWLTLLGWLPAMQRVQDLGRPHNWMDPPTPVAAFEPYSTSIPCALFTLVLLAGLSFLFPSQPTEFRFRPRSTLLTQSLLWTVLPLFVAAESWIAAPIFVDRYFFPSLLGIAVLFAYLTQTLLAHVKLTPALQAIVAGLLILLLALPIVSSTTEPKPAAFNWLVANLAHDGPIVVENANQFLPLNYYSDPRVRPFYYVFDWDSAVGAASLHATVQAKIMNRLRTDGYYADRILDGADALCRFDHFLVLHDQGMGWVQKYLPGNRAFIVQQTGVLPPMRGVGPTIVLQVDRVATPEACAAN
jgi:4-amino-4-deoxy-L-arabinose transferase-like glycosyltransferase